MTPIRLHKNGYIFCCFKYQQPIFYSCLNHPPYHYPGSVRWVCLVERGRGAWAQGVPYCRSAPGPDALYLALLLLFLMAVTGHSRAQHHCPEKCLAQVSELWISREAKEIAGAHYCSSRPADYACRRAFQYDRAPLYTR